MDARETALELLLRWSPDLRSRETADELLGAELDRGRLSSPDRALAAELFYGCLRHRLALDRLATELAPQPPRRPVAALLHLGLYQLLFLERIPAYAAVHAVVELAKRKVSAPEARFVNAVLREAGRNLPAQLAKLRAWRETEPWTGYSHPRWLWDRWEARWGRQVAAALCEWNNAPAPVYVRVNTLKATDTTDVRRGPPEGVAVEASGFHPLCWRVTDPARLFETRAWVGGEIYAQDPSTLVAVDLLDPQSGETILDLCAAPGGKTTYIAQKMGNRGRIVAADSSAERLGRLAENCRRLGAGIVAALACEGTGLVRCLGGSVFDRVLADVPCSNTGVLRRRVDLRWRLQESEIRRLAALQDRLIEAAAMRTRRDGVLVYSTCSLEPEENERVVERFRERHPRWALETTRSTFPPRDGVDGSFVARFRNRQ